MASRQYIPEFTEADIGPDTQKIAKRFTELRTIEFAAGKDLTGFVKDVMAATQLRVEAAAGAGKTIRMPSELVRGGVGLVVQCFPSRPLAVGTYDAVTQIGGGDVPLHFIDELLDEYPSSGIVFTNSATFCLQASRWRVRGVDPRVTLFMDEVHESDAATTTLRTLRTQVPGVARYLEASATFGTGDASSAFAKPRMPSTLTPRETSLLDPKDWDISAHGVAWSLKQSRGHFLIFNDNPEHRAVLKAKFEESGVTAHVLTAHSTPEEFRGVIVAMRGDTECVHVLMVDYSYRSGHTFTTIVRIIDFALVGYYTEENGRTIMRFRKAYSAEIYQGMNRGARLAGLNCDYIRQSGNIDNNMVLVEGCEVDLACIFTRMLGFRPGNLFQGSLFCDGLIPRSIVSVVRGPQAMRCYKPVKEWPGNEVVSNDVEPASPLDLPSDDSGELAEADEVRSFSRGRSPSVWTVGSGDLALGSGSRCASRGLDAVRSRSGSVAGDPRAADQSAVRRERSSYVRTSAATESLNTLNSFAARATPKRVEMELGVYYTLLGYEASSTSYFPDGVSGVINSANGRGREFYRGLRPEIRAEAFVRALEAHNQSTVRYNAAIGLIAQVNRRRDEFAVVHDEPFKQWVSMIRDVLVSAESVIFNAVEILRHVGAGSLRSIDPGDYGIQETDLVKFLFNLLNQCVNGSGSVGLLTDSVHGGSVFDAAQSYPQLAARWKVKIVGGGLRERIANAVMGDKPVIMDAMSAGFN